MTLARGKIGGYEFNRMVMLFSMMDGAREIPCAVSASAMDEIEHVSRTAPDQREQQFLRLRDRIAGVDGAVASAIGDDDGVVEDPRPIDRDHEDEGKEG